MPVNSQASEDPAPTAAKVAGIDRMAVRWIVVALAIAVAFRLFAFIGTAVHPIATGDGIFVSPLHYQGSDLENYAAAARLLFDRPPGDTVADIRAYLRTHDHKDIELIAVGPLVPYLIHAFDYRPGHTLSLAVLYLAISIAGVLPWLLWLRKLPIADVWLVVFAVVPLPVWYMLGVSLDLPFATLFGWFFFFYFLAPSRPAATTAWLVLLMALVLTRPNANPIVAFVFLDQAYRWWRGACWQHSLIVLAATGLIGFGALLLHIPPMLDLQTSAVITEFFGIQASAYQNGLFPGLPTVVDRPLSWLLLFVAKCFYAVGLRPSYSGTSLSLVMLRLLPGLIFLAGLCYVFIRGERRIRALLLLYLAPVFLGATQERYVLPIMPILFGYGIMWLERTFDRSMQLFHRSA